MATAICARPFVGGVFPSSKSPFLLSKHSLRQVTFTKDTVQTPRKFVMAGAETKEKESIEQFSESIGLPTEEGLFGFTPFAEVWTGRLAMLGFLASIVGEATTRKGTLQQVGLLTPNPALLSTILGVTTVVTSIAAFRTVQRAQRGEMSDKEKLRYRKFLGLSMEGRDVAEAQKQPKPVDTFLNYSDRNAANVAASKAKEAGDAFSIDPIGAAEKASAELKSRAESAAEGVGEGLQNADRESAQELTGGRVDPLEQPQFQSGDMKFARGIELANGRWAMLGFWFCLAVEAGTGKGILGQVIGYLRLTGLLGDESGFVGF